MKRTHLLALSGFAAVVATAAGLGIAHAPGEQPMQVRTSSAEMSILVGGDTPSEPVKEVRGLLTTIGGCAVLLVDYQPFRYYGLVWPAGTRIGTMGAPASVESELGEFPLGFDVVGAGILGSATELSVPPRAEAACAAKRYLVVKELTTKAPLVQPATSTAESRTSRPPTPGADPSQWVISPDSYGPITTDMTKEQVLATGAFREAPDACRSGRLDWYTQTYKDEYGYKSRQQDGLGSITLQDGKPYYIDPGKDVRTDTGIRAGDTVAQLHAAYPGRVVRQPPMGFPDEDFYGVSGDASHLVFYAYRGTIKAFYLTPEALLPGEEFGADMRGIAC